MTMNGQRTVGGLTHGRNHHMISYCRLAFYYQPFRTILLILKGHTVGGLTVNFQREIILQPDMQCIQYM